MSDKELTASVIIILIIWSGIYHLIMKWIKLRPEVERAKHPPLQQTKEDVS